MLIINRINIIEWDFKDFVKGAYARIYQLSNKKMDHLIISNYE